MFIVRGSHGVDTLGRRGKERTAPTLAALVEIRGRFNVPVDQDHMHKAGNQNCPSEVIAVLESPA
jgi:hypothetical protein